MSDGARETSAKDEDEAPTDEASDAAEASDGAETAPEVENADAGEPSKGDDAEDEAADAAKGDEAPADSDAAAEGAKAASDDASDDEGQAGSDEAKAASDDAPSTSDDAKSDDAKPASDDAKSDDAKPASDDAKSDDAKPASDDARSDDARSDDAKPASDDAKPASDDARSDDAKPAASETPAAKATPAPAAASAGPAPAASAPASPAPSKAALSAVRPPPLLGTRIVGLAWLLLFGVLGFVLVRRVYTHDFGTTNTRILSVIRIVSILVTGYPALLGLLALITGRRPPAKFNPLGLPLSAWWYQGLNALGWRELKRIFFHPVAYIVLFVYLLINGFLFMMLIKYYANAGPQAPPMPAAHFLTNNFYLWLSVILICPALTMGLIAEERRTKSVELLLTAPVTETQVVISKWGAVSLYFVFMTLFSLGYASLLKTYAASWDWGPVLSGYLGLVLIGMLVSAIGVFTSSLTRSQIIAYLTAALILVCLFVILQMVVGSSPGMDPTARAVLEHFTISSHQDQFATGVISWRSLTYCLSTTALFLFLGVQGLAAQGGR